MKVKVWGARGSIPTPGPDTMRYGGNTSCVQVTLSDGSVVVLDAGTGIRTMGLALGAVERPLTILLTHLHLDHIQGLMFFAPCFHPESEIVIWGPAAAEAPLLERIARYISAPLSPVEVRELPCRVSFREAQTSEWQVGPATVHAHSVSHRGPTLGYRIEDDGMALAYIPDHEPALGAPLETLEDEWISGLDLARGADLLIHDAQYTDAEYPDHLGWGHSSLSDALAFGARSQARRMLLFHHEPLHDDAMLDALGVEARERWQALGGNPQQIAVAQEGMELVVAGARRAAAVSPRRAP
ncbi:MAG TPA: MBL fold metallo-hydrolase [Solirubrobacteraceae bacterium]|nr:MBL fold metallo-hydrolase [Solirubrobacteraceae bacterium]